MTKSNHLKVETKCFSWNRKYYPLSRSKSKWGFLNRLPFATYYFPPLRKDLHLPASQDNLGHCLILLPLTEDQEIYLLHSPQSHPLPNASYSSSLGISLNPVTVPTNLHLVSLYSFCHFMSFQSQTPSKSLHISLSFYASGHEKPSHFSKRVIFLQASGSSAQTFLHCSHHPPPLCLISAQINHKSPLRSCWVPRHPSWVSSESLTYP